MNVTKYNRLLKSITSFQDFEDKIASYTNKQKGDIFELLTKYLLQTDYIFNFKKVYLYDEIPDKILDELKFPSNDKCIDLLIITKDNKYIAIQCKYRSNNLKATTWNLLSTIFGFYFPSNTSHLLIFLSSFVTLLFNSSNNVIPPPV